MAETEVVLDRAQVKKAVQALQAFLKTKSKRGSLFPDDTQQISVLFTFWKIPRETQTIRIPLPHGQRTDTEEVCLFTRDEPKMTSEQTQRFYKRLLEEKGVTNVAEIIPYKVLKTEYKPYEAKRRLLGNFAVFISDDRIRRLLPSHIGKHFYLSKKEPLCVNLQSKHLARDIQRIIQGTRVKITNKGSCCMARVAHSGMTADEVTENIEAAIQTVAAKIRMKGPVMKVIHIKSQRSVALPIYTSDISNFSVLEGSKKNTKNQKYVVKKWTKKNKTKDVKKDTTEDVKQDTVADVMEDIKKDTTEDVMEDIKKDTTEDVKEDTVEDVMEDVKEDTVEDVKEDATEGVKQTDITAEDEEEEELPELVPIATPMKKPKLEKPSKKKQLEKAPESSVKKNGMKTRSSLTKKAGKADSKVKVPKVK